MIINRDIRLQVICILKHTFIQAAIFRAIISKNSFLVFYQNEHFRSFKHCKGSL